MGLSLERRFERYCDGIVSTLLHADREQPARWYIKGLMLPGERKSVEPMAARVQPQQVRSAHQSMHHLVADAPWRDEEILEFPHILPCSRNPHFLRRLIDVGCGPLAGHGVVHPSRCNEREPLDEPDP